MVYDSIKKVFKVGVEKSHKVVLSVCEEVTILTEEVSTIIYLETIVIIILFTKRQRCFNKNLDPQV